MFLSLLFAFYLAGIIGQVNKQRILYVWDRSPAKRYELFHKDLMRKIIDREVAVEKRSLQLTSVASEQCSICDRRPFHTAWHGCLGIMASINSHGRYITARTVPCQCPMLAEENGQCVSVLISKPPRAQFTGLASDPQIYL